MNFDSIYEADGGTLKKKVDTSNILSDKGIAPATSYSTPTAPKNPVATNQPISPVVTPTATPTVTPVKTISPPSGSLGVADTLKGQGYDVTWNKDQGVLVNGKPVDTSKFTLVNGRYYATSSDINNAIKSAGIVPSNEIIPAPVTQVGGTTPVAPTSSGQYDELMKVLMGLINSPDATPNYMSQNDARNAAANELNPEFNSAMTELNRALNIDMEKRGIFNSPLASGIFTDKNSALEASRLSEIAKRSTEILQQDKADSNTAAQLALQSKNARMDSLSSLLNTLSNRELSVAEMTGVINGVKTIAAQQFEEDKRMNDVKTKFSEAELTGLYNGIPTLAGKDAEVKAWATKMDAAMNEVNLFGKVTTQATADALGVPLGTASYEAIKAAEDRAFEWKSLMTQIKASSTSDSKTTLNQDLAMWEIMGTAPETDNLKAYGIAPGTKWNKSSADALAEKQASIDLKAIESDEAFMSRVTTASKQYGVSEDTAAALLALYENTNRDSAFIKFNAEKNNLKKEGVDVGFLETKLNERFPKVKGSTSYTGLDSTQYDPALVNQNYGPTY